MSVSAIVALAVFLRVWGMDYGVPHRFARPDEEILVERAFQMVGTGNLDPEFFEYPSLPFYLTAAGMTAHIGIGMVTGRYDEPFDFLFDAVVTRHGLHFRIARTLNVLLAAATVLVTFWLGWRAYDSRAVGVLAASFLAVCPLHVIFSRFATVDVSMTFFVTLALVFALAAARDRRWSAFAFVGVSIGLAASTKYNAALLGPSLALAVMILLLRDRKATESKKAAWGLFLAAVLSMLAFAVTSPFALVHWEILSWGLEKHRWMYLKGPDELGYWVHATKTFPLGLGWPLYAASLVGIGRALWLRRSADVVLLCFLIPFFVLIGGVRVVYPRYVLPLLPVMFVFAADACLSLRRWRRGNLWVALVVMLALAPGVVRSVGFNRLASRRDTRLLASQWVAEHLPRRSSIAVCRGYGAPQVNQDRRRAPAFDPIEVSCTPDAILSSGAPYVITHEHPVLTRYSFVPPETRDVLRERGELLIDFDPFLEEGSIPFFYYSDAFYLPLSDHGAMERGGPIVKIWKLREEHRR